METGHVLCVLNKNLNILGVGYAKGTIVTGSKDISYLFFEHYDFAKGLTSTIKLDLVNGKGNKLVFRKDGDSLENSDYKTATRKLILNEVVMANRAKYYQGDFVKTIDIIQDKK